jgi:hypothetical protein
MVHLFSKTGAVGRSKGAAKADILPWGDAQLEKLIEKDLFDALAEEIELLDALVRVGVGLALGTQAVFSWAAEVMHEKVAYCTRHAECDWARAQLHCQPP